MNRNPYALVVDGYLEDFEGGIGVLEKYPGDTHAQAAEVLCELSRDILFTIGDSSEYDASYIKRIIDLFEKASKRIQGNSEDLVAFREHISSRAERLREELSIAHGRQLAAHGSS